MTTDEVMEWFATGEKGVSSETMACYLGLGKRKSDGYHPLDPADFDRCLGLLAAAPSLRAQLPRMAEFSPAWAKLVARWDEVERCHLDEVGLGWSKAKSAPRTYKLMQEVYGDEH